MSRLPMAFRRGWVLFALVAGLTNSVRSGEATPAGQEPRSVDVVDLTAASEESDNTSEGKAKQVDTRLGTSAQRGKQVIVIDMESGRSPEELIPALWEVERLVLDPSAPFHLRLPKSQASRPRESASSTPLRVFVEGFSHGTVGSLDVYLEDIERSALDPNSPLEMPSKPSQPAPRFDTASDAEDRSVGPAEAAFEQKIAALFGVNDGRLQRELNPGSAVPRRPVLTQQAIFEMERIYSELVVSGPSGDLKPYLLDAEAQALDPAAALSSADLDLRRSKADGPRPTPKRNSDVDIVERRTEIPAEWRSERISSRSANKEEEVLDIGPIFDQADEPPATDFLTVDSDDERATQADQLLRAIEDVSFEMTFPAAPQRPDDAERIAMDPLSPLVLQRHWETSIDGRSPGRRIASWKSTSSYAPPQIPTEETGGPPTPLWWIAVVNDLDKQADAASLLAGVRDERPKPATSAPSFSLDFSSTSTEREATTIEGETPVHVPSSRSTWPWATALKSGGPPASAEVVDLSDLAGNGTEDQSNVTLRFTTGTPRPGDPEWPRFSPETSDDKTATANSEKDDKEKEPDLTPKCGDPEFRRNWPAAEKKATTTEEDPQNIQRQAEHSSRIAYSNDRPRFVVGQGVDDSKTQMPRASDGAAEDDQKDADDSKRVAEAKRRQEAIRRKLLAAKREREKAGKKKGKKDVDPEERTKALLEEIRLQGELKQAELEARQAGKKPASNAGDESETGKKSDADDWLATRSPQAARALDALDPKAAIGTLQGRIVDAKTKRPLPCRVKVTDASDATAGARIPGLGFWCNGAFSVPVLAGKVKVEISAGRFCRQHIEGVQVDPKKITTVSAMLSRPDVFEFARQGWYLADLDLPLLAIEGELPVWVGPKPGVRDVALAARAEGVDIIGLSQPWGPELEDLAENTVVAGLRGSQSTLPLILPALRGPKHPFCGNALGIGIRSWKDIPRHLNSPRESLRDHLEDIRRRGGLAVFTDLAGLKTVNPKKDVLPFVPRLLDDGFYRAGDTRARLCAPAELPYATVVGPSYDVLAYDSSETATAIWFRLLNEGYAIPVIAAGGGGLAGGRVPFGRTFVRPEGGLTWESVLDACRKGKSAISFGPAVFAKVLEREKHPGDRLPANGRRLTLRIQAYASMARGAHLRAIEVIRNGHVVHRERALEGQARIDDFRYPFREKRNAWYIVRVTERVHLGPRETDRIALTNPFYFDAPGRKLPAPAKTRMRGTLRRPGGTPLPGRVTVIEPGRERRVLQIGTDGKYDVTLTASGALVFFADGYEPLAKKPFEDRSVQEALGAIHTERSGSVAEQLSRRATFGLWRLLIADMNTDITLRPLNRSKRRTR